MKTKNHIITTSLLAIAKFYIATFACLLSFNVTAWQRISAFAFILVTLFLLPSQHRQIKIPPKVAQDRKIPFPIPSPALYPVNRGGLPPPELSAEGIDIVDVSSAVPIYEKNAQLRLHPASTTKIMTALVVLDHFPVTSVVEVNTVIKSGKTMGLIKGERLTVESLLYGLVVDSANDAAYTLAEHYPGGVEAFVEAMNKKAQSLHLVNSHFTNPIGFEEDNHFMTASDLARLSLVAIQNPLLAKIASTRSITVADETYSYFHDLTNVNQLLGKIPGVAGFKTGWTESAGECLVTLFNSKKARYIIVLLGSNKRFPETEKLLSWVEQNISWEPVSKNVSLLEVTPSQQ